VGARGPAPKSPEQLAARSKTAADKAHIRIVTSEVVPAPDLPAFMPGGKIDEDTGEIGRTEWPEQTLTWWKCWTEDPLTDDYRNSDWLDLLDCALIHGRLWNGDDKAAGELRLRMSRHGATKDDRARLRITYATADLTEKRAGTPASAPSRPSAKERRGGLRSVPQTADDLAPF